MSFPELLADAPVTGAHGWDISGSPHPPRRFALTTSVPAGSRPPELRSGLGSIAFLGDDALADLVAGGDERAFEVLYQRHRSEIFRYCGVLVRQAQDAEEAFQLTMLAAYRALSSGSRRPAALRAWLFRIAHNECMDLLRGRPRVEELTDQVDPVAGSVHERAEVREQVRELSADIAALPLRQRSALVLHEMSGLSHAAVGEALGTTASDARHLLHEARVSLAAYGLGREQACQDVRGRIADGDRRAMRARTMKAHLRGCGDCRAFAAAQDDRRRRFGAFFPVLPSFAAARILQGVLGGGGGTAGAGTVTAGVLGGGAGVAGGTLGVGAVAGFGAAAAGVVATMAVTVGGVGPLAPVPQARADASVQISAAPRSTAPGAGVWVAASSIVAGAQPGVGPAPSVIPALRIPGMPTVAGYSGLVAPAIDLAAAVDPAAIAAAVVPADSGSPPTTGSADPDPHPAATAGSDDPAPSPTAAATPSRPAPVRRPLPVVAPASPVVDPGVQDAAEQPAPDPSPVVPPLLEIPPVDIPAIETPPAETSPLEIPPLADIPPVDPPAVESPPVDPLLEAELPPLDGPVVVEPLPVDLPPVDLPPVDLPPADLPAVELPAAELPAVEPPAAELPAVEPPAAELPAAEPPAVEPPAVEPPPMELPPVELPAEEPPPDPDPVAPPPAEDPTEIPVVEETIAAVAEPGVGPAPQPIPTTGLAEAVAEPAPPPNLPKPPPPVPEPTPDPAPATPAPEPDDEVEPAPGAVAAPVPAVDEVAPA